MQVRPLFMTLALSLGSYGHASSHSLLISADTTQFDYAETDSFGLLDTETNKFGDINGFTVSLEPRYEGFYVGGSYAEGNTDYIGSTNINPIYGSHRTITHNRLTDYTAGYKLTTVLDQGRLEIPLKIGLGYREWERNIQSTPTVSGIGELYEWGYFDVGLGLHAKTSYNITFGIDANYRTAFNAQMYENWYGNTYKLKNVYGYKITVPLEITLNQSWSTFFIYNYEYWNIGASDPVGGYYEPDSETKNQTLSVGLSYKF